MLFFLIRAQAFHDFCYSIFTSIFELTPDIFFIKICDLNQLPDFHKIFLMTGLINTKNIHFLKTNRIAQSLKKYAAQNKPQQNQNLLLG